MATIANLTVKSDDSFEGNLATLTVSAPIAIIPNNRKTKDSEPDYRIVSRKNGFELGAGWKRFSQNTGAEYVSVSLSAPEFGTIYGLSLIHIFNSDLTAYGHERLAAAIRVQLSAADSVQFLKL